jgi:hypothetical protein
MNGERMEPTEESPPSIITPIGVGERQTPGEWFEEIDERGELKIKHE